MRIEPISDSGPVTLGDWFTSIDDVRAAVERAVTEGSRLEPEWVEIMDLWDESNAPPAPIPWRILYRVTGVNEP